MWKDKFSKDYRPGNLLRIIQLLFICVLGVLLLVTINKARWRSPEESRNVELEIPDGSDPDKLLDNLPLPHHSDAINKHPPPVWGQMDEETTTHGSKLSGSVMLMFALGHNVTTLIKSMENILHTTSGSGMHLAICVRDESLLPLLQEYPVRVHFVGVPDPGRKSILDSIQGVWKSARADVCRQDEILPRINVLNTDINTTQTSVHGVTLADRLPKPGENRWNGTITVPFEDHPYNPMLRRAKVSQEEENRQSGEKEEQKEDCSVCRDSNFLMESLDWALESFPSAEYFILLNDDVHFSPDIISFYSQTVPVFSQDLSVYCISASNPLASNDPADPTRLHRVDHFVWSGSLIQRKLMKEIHKDFVIHTTTPGQAPPYHQNPLKWLESWLSWWSRRRRRGCVVPALPRLCSQQTSYHACSDMNHVEFADVSRMVHYRYSQDSYYELEKAEPLGINTADCSKAKFFPKPMNSSSYVIYIKMQEYSDDFTLHHILKCCGIDVEESVGHFEGIYRFMCRGKQIFILGIPFSRYSSSIKRGDAVILAAFGKSQFGGTVNYKRYKENIFNYEYLNAVKIVN